MSFKSPGTVVYRKKRRLGRGKMLTLTHHFQPLPRAFSKRRPRQPRLFAGVIGLCLAFVGTSNWESKGAKRRGGSSRALAKPFMVRGVAESLAHPSGEKPSCSMAMVYGPGRLCSLLSFHAPSLVTPSSQQRTQSWPKTLVAPAASSSLETMGYTQAEWGWPLHPQWPGSGIDHRPSNEGVNTSPASMQGVPGEWGLEPALCWKQGCSCFRWRAWVWPHTLILFSHFDAEPHRAVDVDCLIFLMSSLLEVYFFKTKKGLESHVNKTTKLKPIIWSLQWVHSFIPSTNL